MRPIFNSVYFYDNAEVLFNGESTQTYFVNVCGYWPGLVTGLEVVGSIISTKGKRKEKKNILCVIYKEDKHSWDNQQSCNIYTGGLLFEDFPDHGNH